MERDDAELYILVLTHQVLHELKHAADKLHLCSSGAGRLRAVFNFASLQTNSPPSTWVRHFLVAILVKGNTNIHDGQIAVEAPSSTFLWSLCSLYEYIFAMCVEAFTFALLQVTSMNDDGSAEAGPADSCSRHSLGIRLISSSVIISPCDRHHCITPPRRGVIRLRRGTDVRGGR